MGWGVRALQDIPEGTFVCEYDPLIRSVALHKNEHKSTAIFKGLITFPSCIYWIRIFFSSLFLPNHFLGLGTTRKKIIFVIKILGVEKVLLKSYIQDSRNPGSTKKKIIIILILSYSINIIYTL